MNYFLDTEFIDDGTTIDLISIGIVAEDGRELYRQSEDFDPVDANQWVRENVFPHLQDFDPPHRVRPHGHIWSFKHQIAWEIQEFVGIGKTPVFWGYYCAYDWVVLCQLFGPMVDLPQGWPMYCLDLRQFLDLYGLSTIKQPDDMPHHALSDARWIKETWDVVQEQIHYGGVSEL